MRRADRPGFTLIELMVAVSICGVLLLIARALVDVLGEHTERSAAASRLADADANGERLLRSLVGSIQIGNEQRAVLDGDVNHVDVLTWCRSPRGWMESCSVSLVVELDAIGPALVARYSTGPGVTLRRAAGTIEIRYLADAASGGSWSRDWHQKFATPLAIAVLLDGDTMIVRIGERG